MVFYGPLKVLFTIVCATCMLFLIAVVGATVFVALPRLVDAVQSIDPSVYVPALMKIGYYFLLVFVSCLVAIVLAFILAVIGQFLYLLFQKIRAYQLSERADRIVEINREIVLLQEQSAIFSENTEMLMRSMHELSQRTANINQSFKNMKRNLKRGFRQLERDLNGLVSFFLHQLGENTAELFALCQAFITLFVPEALGQGSLTKMVSFGLGVLIFVLASTLKNPYRTKLRKVLTILLFQVSLMFLILFGVLTEHWQNLALGQQRWAIFFVFTSMAVLVAILHRVLTSDDSFPGFDYLRRIIRS